MLMRIIKAIWAGIKKAGSAIKQSVVGPWRPPKP